MNPSVSTIRPLSGTAKMYPSAGEREPSDVTALALTDDELTYFHATRYVLRTHKNLSPDDIRFVSNYVASFRASGSNDDFNDDQFAMFLAYADVTGIGKFALIFNEELDSAIKSQDSNALHDMLLGPKEMFVEVYDNPFLTDDDRESSLLMLSRSIYANKLMLDELRKLITSLENIDDSCSTDSALTAETSTSSGVSTVTIAARCYQAVCIQESKILSEDAVRAQINMNDKPPQQVYAVDKSASKLTPQVYCFDTLELLKAVSQDNAINPKTNEPFSPEALNLIKQKFHRELAMYRRYQQP